MKLFTALTFVTLGLGLGAGAMGFAAQGCSSSSSDDTGGATAAGQPPAKPDAPATTSTDERTYAINQLFLGETDRNGTDNKSNGWKQYGYNLDGLTTTASSTDVCSPPPGPKSAQEDGNNGIDNSFGHNVLAFILGVAPTPSKTINTSIADGDFTILLNVKGLSDDAKQTATGLSGDLLVGGAFGDGKKPTFTQADDWPYHANPKVSLAGGYINNGTYGFVNGPGTAPVQLSLSLQGQTLNLNINRAVITFDHSSTDEVVNGTIAGVIKTDELVSGIKEVAGSISTELCQGSTLDTIVTTIQRASDMMSDGTNKPGSTCDGISVGIGFTAKRIGPAKTIAQEVAAGANKCAGANADAGAN